MFPRALLVLLAVMNIAVALWWIAHPADATSPPATDLPVGVPALRLLGEVQAAPPVEPERCYRFGPYSDPATLEAARVAAGELAPRVEVVTVPGPAADAWRVAAPPPPDGDTAALATRIVDAGFVDTMIIAEGPEAGSIALGRFSTAEAAGRRQAALREGGFDAQVHPVGGNTDWLRLPLPGEPVLLEVRAALAALQAQPVDCD
ncbi:MAG TPA: hypothetical protein VFM73_05590 [Xanthomonadaceae bacterium]|nr:hypothetical protein [Xanthomonadaceae bacterium]